VLIDAEDVALGHTTKLRWNDTGKWLWSDKIVQPPIIDRDDFDQVQIVIKGRATKHAEHKPHRSRHPYALRGCVWCAVCERRMQSHWAHDVPYYRCRFPAEYALANRVQHPVNAYLREDQLIGEVTRWLASSHRTACAQRSRQWQPPSSPSRHPARTTVTRKPRSRSPSATASFTGYRAALDAGASPATVATWIAETEAEKARYLIFRQLGLRLTYHPGRELVEAQVIPAECGFFESVRGPSRTSTT
jgi:hypothetical protein